MKLGVFAMIPQLNAKVLNGNHQHHQKAKKLIFKSQKSKVKTMLVCFYDRKGIIHHEFVPEGQTVNGSLEKYKVLKKELQTLKFKELS